MDGEWILKVTPERLTEAAGEWQGEVRVIEYRFEQIRDVVTRTMGYWNGDGGEHYRKKMLAGITEASASVVIVRQQIRTLLAIAGIYQKSETENTEKAGSLEGTILK